MNCRRCNWPAAPHELVDHEGEGKAATGVCLKCLKAERDELRAEVVDPGGVHRAWVRKFDLRDLLPPTRAMTDEERLDADRFLESEMNNTTKG